MSVSDARAWFQNEYSGNIADVKSIAGSDKTRLVSYARGVFAGEPDWNYHHQYRHSSNALMIPLDYADTSTKYRGFRDVVVVRNKARKTFNAYVQLEIFKKSYLDSLIKAKGNLPDIRSYSEPATFTGEVLLFSINNEFIRGAVYKNGKRVARIFPKNGIGSMVQGIANSLHSAETYVRFSGGANLAAMTKEGDSKKVALNTTAPTPSYEEAAVHTATSSSGTGDTDSDGDSIWDGTDLGEVSVTSDPTDSNPSGIGWGNDPGDSYPTGNDPTPSDPSSGGGGGGGGATGTTPPLKMSKDDQQKYPRLTEMVKNLRNYVLNDPKVLQALIDFSGLTKSEILNDLTFGNGPTINIVDLDDEFGYFDGSENPNAINIDASYVRGLEIAKLQSTIEATSFLLAVTALHEFVHYGRFFNGLDRTYEYGLGFEHEAYGITIDETNAYEYSWRFYKKN
ncbi:hypothetical protein A9P82_08805 [Arachidicoccus ginsenosidimutans]|nr:hypothetical protein A9P82_08805 [Arachidicoccus sp. BS20]